MTDCTPYSGSLDTGLHCNGCGDRAVLRAAELASIGLLLGIPTHHGIVLNLKTAKTSGINPYINSVRADEVIE